MKKIFSFFIFLLIILIILINSYDIINSIKISFSLCINNIFPSVIPFMLLSNILINYNIINVINSTLKNKITQIFKLNNNCSFVIIMSMLTGSPTNSVYLKNLYDKKLIDEIDISKCINFCHFTNPIFIIEIIGNNFLNNKKLGYIILISQYVSAFIIGLFNKKNKNIICNINNKDNNKSFIKILTEAINNIANNLLIILGIITTFLIISTILNNLININDNYKFIYGLIEVTQGLNYLSISNINIKIKTIIASILISFGGFCIHMQVFSILDNKKIRYIPYLKRRILQSVISAIITSILINNI